ncbi:hypothetical protein [Stappia albiluteola]|nr:hypothetical protein [Stappia albiluteola]
MTGFSRKAGAMIGIAAIAVAISFSIAEAARPDTRRMSCAAAQNLVRQYGAVVMTTGQYTYFRFVSNVGYCDPWEQLRPKTAPTKDHPKCIVGYECAEPLFPFWDD